MSSRILLAVMNYHGANAVLLETAGAFAAEWTSRLDVLFPHPPIWERDFVAIPTNPRASEFSRSRNRPNSRKTKPWKRGERSSKLCARVAESEPRRKAAENRPLAVWIPMRGTVRDTQVLSRARLADLVLVQRPHATSGENYDGLISSILYESGRRSSSPRRAEPRRSGQNRHRLERRARKHAAVAAAMSLIGEAARVDIITAASDRTPETAAGNLANYLAGHGISATTHVLNKQWNRSVGETILEKCHEFGSDMLVMGAYARNRWREMVFGGVTRHILGHAELPVLMAH